MSQGVSAVLREERWGDVLRSQYDGCIFACNVGSTLYRRCVAVALVVQDCCNVV